MKDDTRQTSLGSLSVRLSRLLTAEDMTLDQWFQLENSGPGSRIYMKLVMRVKPGERDWPPGRGVDLGWGVSPSG